MDESNDERAGDPFSKKLIELDGQKTFPYTQYVNQKLSKILLLKSIHYKDSRIGLFFQESV